MKKFYLQDDVDLNESKCYVIEKFKYMSSDVIKKTLNLSLSKAIK